MDPSLHLFGLLGSYQLRTSILGFLSARELFRIEEVCRLFRELVQEHLQLRQSPTFYRQRGRRPKFAVTPAQPPRVTLKILADDTPESAADRILRQGYVAVEGGSEILLIENMSALNNSPDFWVRFDSFFLEDPFDRAGNVRLNVCTHTVPFCLDVSLIERFYHRSAETHPQAPGRVPSKILCSFCSAHTDFRLSFAARAPGTLAAPSEAMRNRLVLLPWAFDGSIYGSPVYRSLYPIKHHYLKTKFFTDNSTKYSYQCAIKGL
ncbi:uncharacterized protein BJ171DRAFT_495099 [Polychytrium aggregatum]|uniref:uncharacterized protein n=1 Tax=Polychytrium aggregatum TaxID=110093 RepID=UPI0022FE106C|nr:uncharacterized protein BJ171DRAFT_495099 [Polychytrium aggregatum]KAI9206899.1 hypothetical protein BJ171DRAFT_495099 [Polychytrium aggregatum]